MDSAQAEEIGRKLDEARDKTQATLVVARKHLSEVDADRLLEALAFVRRAEAMVVELDGYIYEWREAMGS